MKRINYSYLIAIILFAINTQAQEKLPKVHIEELTQKFQEIASNTPDAYDEMLEVLEQVHPNDTSYCDILLNKSFYAMQKEDFDRSIAYCKEGLSLSRCEKNESTYYINLAVAYTKSKQETKAVEIVDEAIQRFPFNTKLLYQKAVALINLKKFKEAAATLETCLQLNPYDSNTYLQLAVISMNQKMYAQATMAMNMSLFMEPVEKNALARLQLLNEMCSHYKESAKEGGVYNDLTSLTPSIDIALESGIALNSKYDSGNKIKLAVVSQNHALLSQIHTVDTKGQEGFLNKHIIEWHQWVMENDKFDELMYTICFSMENRNYTKLIQKNVGKVKGFIQEGAEQYTDKVAYQTEQWDGKEQKIAYYFSDGYMAGVGPFEK